ncbi:MAG: hypothetical protein IIB19_04340 [Chloroflexi bacterium]|nr:hypothetical protein [Chloroflexota bacterium]
MIGYQFFEQHELRFIAILCDLVLATVEFLDGSFKDRIEIVAIAEYQRLRLDIHGFQEPDHHVHHTVVKFSPTLYLVCGAVNTSYTGVSDGRHSDQEGYRNKKPPKKFRSYAQFHCFCSLEFATPVKDRIACFTTPGHCLPGYGPK